ncbi:MAG TPA: hypothetical protein PKZ27_16505, partial [Rhodocyclaceae bacterium]|nr:hypothetical protein [Rhodocyclaceae bacterium]
AFAGAPRYHTGGIAGLRPDEIPTILKKREEVLTEDDPRHRQNGGLDGAPASPRPLRLIMVDDERKVGDWMRSAEGDEVLVERVQRNAMALRGALGI